MSGPETPSLSVEAFENLETGAQANLADTALRLAAKAGAAYAD